MRYLFDISTTARWQGLPVGIVRVERELAARARHELGAAVAFCVFDRHASSFRVLDEPIANDVLSTKSQLSFDKYADDAEIAPRGLRRKLRNAALRQGELYRYFQTLRGRPMTPDQVMAIQKREFGDHRVVAVESRSIPLHSGASYLAKLDSDLVIISGGLDWEFKDMRAILRLKQHWGFRYVSIIYDLIPLRFPQFVVPSYVDLLTDYFGELSWLADRAMCISETTKADWLAHVERTSGRTIPSKTFHLGCDPGSAMSVLGDETVHLPAVLTGKRFILYVSTIEPRKNHRLVYHAWEECIRNGTVDKERDRLVFVGRRGWGVNDLLHEIEINPLTRESIILLHDIPDAQLESLYQKCDFVLFPSLFEGFGLPVVEALVRGKLCVTSNSGALAEIGGDLVMRIDARDTIGWADAIGRLMSSRSLIRDWEQRVSSQYRPVTWDDSASSFFRSIANT